MKHTLVGCTGFVGGNLLRSHKFDAAYHSSDISESFGADNGLVVYSGMPSEKFLANSNPKADLAQAENALQNIRRMRPQRLVLISTVDVYKRPYEVYEDSPAEEDNAAYGKNRYELEKWVRKEYPDALILRLPGLFGAGLKKNFIFDAFTLTPSALTAEKYAQLCKKSELVAQSYRADAGGFYRLVPLQSEQASALREFYKNSDFNALCFTDSRAVFQFYNLERLWEHIQLCLAKELRLVNLATQPIEAAFLYEELFGKQFKNELPKPPPQYDMRTRHAGVLGGSGDYLASRKQVAADIAKFANSYFGGAK